jgi:hypothetical protein
MGLLTTGPPHQPLMLVPANAPTRLVGEVPASSRTTTLSFHSAGQQPMSCSLPYSDLQQPWHPDCSIRQTTSTAARGTVVFIVHTGTSLVLQTQAVTATTMQSWPAVCSTSKHQLLAVYAAIDHSEGCALSPPIAVYR